MQGSFHRVSNIQGSSPVELITVSVIVGVVAAGSTGTLATSWR